MKDVATILILNTRTFDSDNTVTNLNILDTLDPSFETTLNVFVTCKSFWNWAFLKIELLFIRHVIDDDLCWFIKRICILDW